MHAETCMTATITQSVFTTRFANWHFSLPNKSNLAFSKGVWKSELLFGTKWWKASVFSALLKCWKEGLSFVRFLWHFQGLWAPILYVDYLNLRICSARTSGVMEFNLRVHFPKLSAPLSDKTIRRMWKVCERDKPFEFRNDFDVRRKCL